VASDRGEAFERFSRIVDGPMIVLAMAMIPLIVVPVVVDLSPSLDRAFLAVDYVIWTSPGGGRGARWCWTYECQSTRSRGAAARRERHELRSGAHRLDW
jgi:hypothetical protein